MRTANEFYEQIRQLEPNPVEGDKEYGSRVMPVLSVYKSLTTYEERRAFQDALEKMLADVDPAVRKFAVDICLGFFVFRTVM